MIIKFGLVNDIWYQTYIDNITDQWTKGPLTEIKAIKVDEDCDKDTLLEYMKAEAPADGHTTDTSGAVGFDAQ